MYCKKAFLLLFLFFSIPLLCSLFILRQGYFLFQNTNKLGRSDDARWAKKADDLTRKKFNIKKKLDSQIKGKYPPRNKNIYSIKSQVLTNYSVICARNFSILVIISHATFQNCHGAKFLDKINRWKAQDCKHNLSPTVLRGYQMVYFLTLSVPYITRHHLITRIHKCSRRLGRFQCFRSQQYFKDFY